MNRQVEAKLNAQIQQALRTHAPLPGWSMPTLKGKTSRGQDEEIILQRSAPKIALLVFDPMNCPTCDANWTFWNKMLADAEISSRFLVLTTAASVPKEYWQQRHITSHPLLAG